MYNKMHTDCGAGKAVDDGRTEHARRRVEGIDRCYGGLSGRVPGGRLQPRRHQHAHQAARDAVDLSCVPARRHTRPLWGSIT